MEIDFIGIGCLTVKHWGRIPLSPIEEEFLDQRHQVSLKNINVTQWMAMAMTWGP
jgi:hypothetical protein